MAKTRKPATSSGELVSRCQDGQRDAFSEFYECYRADVARVLYRILGPDADLEDTLQDVFMEVFRSIEGFRGESRVRTWLYRVCCNVALQRLRRSKRRPEGYAVRRKELAHEETPLRALERKDNKRVVYSILDTLPPKKRIVFILHEIFGLEPKEIAPLVGANALTVRTRLHYARKDFYGKLARTNLFSPGDTPPMPLQKVMI